MKATNYLKIAGSAILALVAAGLIAGCATQRAMQTERILSASGFHMKLAQTPEQQQQLAAYPQRKLITEQKDGQPYFVYADAKDCNCVYVGDETAYQSYQNLVEDQQLADEDRMTAEMNEDTAMDWGLWGGWDSWGW